MTGQTQGETKTADRPALATVDADTVERIDVHLERALGSEGGDKDFHVRHARQLLEACKER